MSKRQDYISWDEYFMGIAILSGFRSKDPSTQVGACVVDGKTNRILSLGYNGLPLGCSDDEFPWNREGQALDSKYLYVVHAELNAILNNRNVSLEGSRIYTTLFPCNECTKAIIQSGIKEVVYLGDKYSESDNVKASKLMLEKAGVSYRPFKTDLDQLIINYKD
ncbi:MAG: dCMP deaminase family protein [Clostridia bacterium]|nr:dCMP deaminase family protein [Clostridia bacterium]